MARRATVAIVGGTFDRLHRGHLALFEAAFASAQRVAIGLTTDRYLTAHPKPSGDAIRPYGLRRRTLARRLHARFPGRAFTIVPLNDPMGRALRPGVDVLIVSEETRSGANAVNRARRSLGLPPLSVRVVPRVIADDLRPLASRRIRAGEIDGFGRRRTPIVVRLASGVPELTDAVRAAVGAEFGRRVDWRTEPASVRVAAAPRSRRDFSESLPSLPSGVDLQIVIAPAGRGGARIAARTPESAVGDLRIPRTDFPRAGERLARLLRPRDRRDRGVARAPARRSASRRPT